MVRETRHLWVGNLPENIREERIREHFKRYGRVQSVKLLPRHKEGAHDGSSGLCATVAFMDIKSASKAHLTEHKIDERVLSTEYYEPAAIPGGSTGSGQLYSPAPPARFPHGPPEELSTFDRSGHFYERGGRSGDADAYLRRSAAAYHVPGEQVARGRPRDRDRDRDRERNGPYASMLHRNGPYASMLERAQPAHHRSIASCWSSYDSASSARYPTQAAPTPDPYPEEPSTRRETQQVVVLKKKRSAKSRWVSSTRRARLRTRSGSESGSNSGSSRSRSRSPSHSSSTSSQSVSSSCSSASSSPASEKSCSPHSQHGGARSGGRLSTVQSTVSTPHQTSTNPSVHSDDSRPLAICVRNLPIRSSDTSLKDGLFHEYKKHGKVTWVKVVGQGGDRYALVCFKKPEDAEKALEVSHDKLFFGCKIEVAPYQGYDVEDNEFRPFEAELNEYHPKATRTLFIGNLEKDVTAQELKKHFEQFGEIIEIDIKKQGGVSSYAFCQFADIGSVVKAMRNLDGENLGQNRIKLGFGKSMHTTSVWVGGLAESVSEKYLSMQFSQFGPVTQVTIDRERGHALVFFEQLPFAQMAVKEMRGMTVRGRKLQVDFASRECQDAFFAHLDKSGSNPSTGERSWDRREASYDARWVATSPKHVHSTRDVSSSRFESAGLVPATRFSRYDSTPQRTRTSSYTRSTTPAAGGGNVTPSGASTPVGVVRVVPRTPRSSQRYEMYDGTFSTDLCEKRYRSYDEFSQGSGGPASVHSDGYEGSPSLCGTGAGVTGSGGSGGLASTSESDYSKRLQSVVVSESCTPHHHSHPPQDQLRHLHKERLHLQHQLEQLDDANSSADEATVPRKRVRVDDNDVLVDSLHNHRRVSDSRRSSDAGKHCGRRQSTDSASKHCLYSPHPVCKRRKTGSSVSEGDERRHHHHHHHSNNDVTVLSGNESGDNSRPGTPLCDERPENLLPPSEPRRIPRERLSSDGPISLPLPRFAAQMQFPTRSSSVSTSTSVPASTPGKSCMASPPAVTSPKAVATSSLLRVPSPTAVPPPASPPPRPPSLPSPSSSDSEISPPSPTLAERVKALDEMFEKWSGSRTFCNQSGEAVSKVTERLRSKHKLLDLDLNEIQPSDIVKSVLAKRSVFDEDSKRLENVSDKYEPKEFVPVMRSRTGSLVDALQTKASTSPFHSSASLPTTPSTLSKFSSPLHSPSLTAAKSPFSSGTSTPSTTTKPAPAATSAAPMQSPKLSLPMPKTAGAVSPRPTTPGSTASSSPMGQGLQYPFPSHPPVQPTTSVATTTAGSLLSVVTVSSSIADSPRTSVPVSPDTVRLKCVTVPTTAVGTVISSGVTACVTGTDPRLTKSPPAASPSASTVSPPSAAQATSPSSVLASPDSTRGMHSHPHGPAFSESSPKSSSVCTSSIPPRQTVKNIPPQKAPSEVCISDSASGSPRSVITPSTVPSVMTSSPSVVSVSSVNIPLTSTVPSQDVPKSRKDSSSKSCIRKEQSSPSLSPKEKVAETSSKCSTPARRESASSSSSTASSCGTKKDSDGDSHKSYKVKTEERRSSTVPAPIGSRRESEQDDRKRDKTFKREAEAVDKERKKDREAESQRRKERESIDSADKERSNRHAERKEERRKERKDAAEKRKDSTEHRSVERRKKDDACDNEDDRYVKAFQCTFDEQKDDKKKEADRRHAEKKEERRKEERRKDSTEKRKDSTENRPVERRKKEEKREISLEELEDPEDSDRYNLEKDQEAKKKEAERRKTTERIREQERQKDADKEKQLKRREERKKEEKSEKRHSSDSSASRRKEGEQSERETETVDSDRKHSDEKRRDAAEPDWAEDLMDTHPERKREAQHEVKTSDVLDRRREESSTSQSDRKKESVVDASSPLDRRREDPRHHSEKKDVDSHLENRRHQPESQAERRHSTDKPKEKPSSDSHKESLDRRKDSEALENDLERRRDRAASIGGKRRISSQDSVDSTPEEAKRLKVTSELSNVPERRDSKDSGRSSGSSKRSSNERYVNSVEVKVDKQKKQRIPSESHPCKDDVDSEDDIKDMKMMSPEFGSNESLDDKGKTLKKDKHEQVKKRKELTRRRENFLTGTDTDGSDDDDKPKKHSIFDIVDDGPAYISMYDKVKARSTKNMQKQEEEKRKEKMEEKFSALKTLRAKREEKKRSTSWDEDSDSESGRGKNSRRKTVITSSSEDDNKTSKSKSKKEETGDSESDSRVKRVSVSDDGLSRNKTSSSRSKAGFHTSEDEHPPTNRLVNRSKGKAQIYSDDSEVDMGFAGSADEHAVSKNRSFQPIRDTTDEETDEPTRRRMFQPIRDTTDEETDLPESSKRRVFLPLRETTDEEVSIDGPYKMAVFTTDEEELTPWECDVAKAKLLDSLKLEKRGSTSKHGQDENLVPNSTPPPPTLENCNSIHSKNKTDPFRKKSHKKKQKKKNSQDVSPDATDKTDLSNSEKKLKKHSSKKERRKSSHSKSVDGDNDEKAKIRRKKMEKMENSIKRDDKMEDIFGPLSEDSENSKPAPPTKTNNRFDKSKWQVNEVYGSDDYLSDEVSRRDLRLAEFRERKEKKRRERKALDKAGRALEAKLVEVEHPSPTKPDVLCTPDIPPPKADAILTKTEVQSSSENTPPPTSATTPSNDFDVFRFTEGDESRESEVATLLDKTKEKRKKRKKSKEEKQNRHHHHHHHHKDLFGDYESRKQAPEENDLASAAIKSEVEEKRTHSIDEDIHSERQSDLEIGLRESKSSEPKLAEEKLASPNSLVQSPNYKSMTSPSPKADPKNNREHPLTPEVKVHEPTDSLKSPVRHSHSPESKTLLSPEHKRPLSPDRKHLEEPKPLLSASLSPVNNKKVVIPGFGKEIDETIHETAVKSIELLEPSKVEVVGSPQPTNIKVEPVIKAEAEEEKAIISQEETEDAVAALLEETFGPDFGGYGNENDSGGNEQTDVAAPAVLDDECLKPDTPQSEPDLQIDTDTEDADRSLTPPAYDIRSTSDAKNHDVPEPVSEGLEERICDIARSRSPPLLVKMSHGDNVEPPKIQEPVVNASGTPKLGSVLKSGPPHLVPTNHIIENRPVEPSPKSDSPAPIEAPKGDVPRLDVQQLETPKRDVPPVERMKANINKAVITPTAEKAKLDMPSLDPKMDTKLESRKPDFVGVTSQPDLKHVAPSVISTHKPEQRIIYQRPVIVSMAQDDKKPAEYVKTFSALNNLDEKHVPDAKTSKEDSNIVKSPVIKGSVIPPMLKQYVKTTLTSLPPPIFKAMAPELMLLANAKPNSAPMPSLTPTQPAPLRGAMLTQPMAPLIRTNIVQARPVLPLQQHVGVTSPTRPPKAVCFASASPKVVNSKITQNPVATTTASYVNRIVSSVAPSAQPTLVTVATTSVTGVALPSSVVTSAENSITPVASISASATTPAEAVTAAAVSSSLYGSKDDRETGFMSPKREDTSRDSDRDDDEGALCIVEDDIVKKEPVNTTSRNIRSNIEEDHLKLDSPIDVKDESDFWSAKEVNIDSVIKKVEAICSNDEIEARKNNKPWINKLEAEKSPWTMAQVKEDSRTWVSNFPGTTSEKEAAKTAKSWMATAPVACDPVPKKEWPEAKVPEKVDGAKPVKPDPDAEAEAADAERRTWLETKTMDQLTSAANKEKERWNLQSFAGGVSDEEDAEKERSWLPSGEQRWSPQKERQVKNETGENTAEVSPPVLKDDKVKSEPEVDEHPKTPPILSPQVVRSTPEAEVKTPSSSDAGKEEAESSELAEDTDADKADDRTDNRRRGRGSRRGARADRGAGVTTRRTRNQPEAATPPSVTTRRSRTRGKGSAGGMFMRKLDDDVYEFRDDSDDEGTKAAAAPPAAPPLEKEEPEEKPDVKEEKEKKEEEKKPVAIKEKEPDKDKGNRPRLILTIKSPCVAAAASASATTTTASTVVVETREEMAPCATTRKSRRLQEKDGSRSTIDDVIEDVVRNANVVTRSAASAENAKNAAIAAAAATCQPAPPVPVATSGPPTTVATTLSPTAPAVAAPQPTVAPPRRLTRQTNRGATQPETGDVRKSPRAGRKGVASRRASTSETRDSSEDRKKPVEVNEPPKVAPVVPATVTPPIPPLASVTAPLTPIVVETSTKAPGKLSTRVLEKEQKELKEREERLRREKEPLMIIDPVSGLLIPMTESEEGQYIPVSNSGHDVKAEVSQELQIPKLAPTSVTTSSTVVPVTSLPSTSTPGLITTAPGWQGAVRQGVTAPPKLQIKAHVLQQTVKQDAKVQAQVAYPQAPAKGIVVGKVPGVAHDHPPVVVSKVIGNVTSTAKVCVVQPGTKVPTTPALPHPKVHLLQTAVSMTPPPMAKVVTVPGAPPLCGVKQTAPLPPKAHILQAVNHASVKTGVSTTPLGVALPQPANVTRDHAMVLPESPSVKVLPGQHVPLAANPKAQALLVGSGAGAAAKGSPPLPLVQPPKAHHVIHGGPPPILTGAVASPPLKVPGSHPSSQQPVITGASSFRTAVPKQHASGGLVTDLLPSSSQFVGSPPPAHQGEIAQHIGIPPHLRHDLAPSAAHYVHPQIMYQQYMPYNLTPTGVRSPHLVAMDTKLEPDLEEACRGSAACSPPLELRRPGSVGSGSGPAAGRTVAHGLHSPHDRTTDSPQVATVYRLPAHCAGQPGRYYAEEPPRAHVRGVARPPHHQPLPGTEAPSAQQRLQVATPPHASQVPPQADSLLMLLQRYPVMWQGLLALKNDQAAVQMHFVHGNVDIARESLRNHLNIAREDGSTPPLRIAQRMRLEQTQVEGVARKMQMGEEHCMLLALPCGRDHLDVLQQSNNLQTGFITYLQQKQAAGIVNIAVTGSTQPSFVMHIFPSCDFANDNLARIAPDLLHRVANLAHLLIVIATV